MNDEVRNRANSCGGKKLQIVTTDDGIDWIYINSQFRKAAESLPCYKIDLDEQDGGMCMECPFMLNNTCPWA